MEEDGGRWREKEGEGGRGDSEEKQQQSSILHQF